MGLTEEAQLKEPPKRRASDASEASSGSSGSNPLMTLVDAAATMIDTKKAQCQDDTKTPAAETEKSEAETVEEAPNQMEVSQANETTQEQPPDQKPAAADTAACTATTTVPPNVITGTKEDLVGDPSKKKTFAEQLYDILEDEEHHDVLQWMPDGLAFTIVDHKKFTLNKMPKLFNIRNMSSFVRKLGRWGFSRVHEKSTRNSDIFKHPLFEKGKRDQCKKKVKCVGRAANKNLPPQPAALSPMKGNPRYPVHFHTVSPRYSDAPLSPASQMFMSNLSERSHLSQLSSSERSRYSFIGGSPSPRVTFLNDHLPRLPSELPLYNEQIPQQSRLPEKLPLYSGDRSLSSSVNPDSPTKQRAMSKVTAASEASAAALFNQHQNHRPSSQGGDSFRDSHLTPYEEARRLSELDRQLAEQQVALEHRKVALEHQRIIRQRQALMAQRRAVESQFSDRGREVPRMKAAPEGPSASREMTSTSETSVAVSLDSSSRSSYGSSSRSTSSLSREDAIRALLREERQRSYNEARQRDRQLAGHSVSMNGANPSSSRSSDSRSGSW